MACSITYCQFFEKFPSIFFLVFYRKTIGNSWKKLSNRLSASSVVSAMSSNTHSFNKEDFEKIEGSVEENPDSLSHVSYI